MIDDRAFISKTEINLHINTKKTFIRLLCCSSLSKIFFPLKVKQKKLKKIETKTQKMAFWFVLCKLWLLQGRLHPHAIYPI